MKSPFSEDLMFNFVEIEKTITADDYKIEFPEQGKINNYFVKDEIRDEVAELRIMLNLVTKCVEQEQQIKALIEENKQLKEKCEKWKRLAQDFDKFSREE